MTTALNVVKALWAYPEAATDQLRPEEAEVLHAQPDDRFLRLATLGWSGNEAILDALRANKGLAWMFTWQFSAKGGLHIFKYPKNGQ